MDTSFCMEAFEETLDRCGKPANFNTDQGSQFAQDAFTGRIKEEESRSPWTARGAGPTMSSSNGCGVLSRVERSTCTPTSRSAKPARVRRLPRVPPLRTSSLEPGGTISRSAILPPSARSVGVLTSDGAGYGNDGLMESAESDATASRPSHKTLKFDEGDLSIPRATTIN